MCDPDGWTNIHQQSGNVAEWCRFWPMASYFCIQGKTMTLPRRSCSERPLLCATPLTSFSHKTFESDFSLSREEGDVSGLVINPKSDVDAEPVQAIVARAKPRSRYHSSA